MTYNKSEIMKRAWELHKIYNRPFGHTLKVAWAEAKERVQFAARIEAAELPEFTGSVKQVAWANDIRKSAFDACIKAAQLGTLLYRVHNYNGSEIGGSLNRDADAAAYAAEETFTALLKTFANLTDASFVITRRAVVSESAVRKTFEGLARQQRNKCVAA